ncbi:MAG: SET domain-containing protein-lysine N-methyltransferase [Saprospiraceae bacterium]
MSDTLYIKEIAGMGRGVFSKVPIIKGFIIEICPVIIIPKIEVPIIHKTLLHDYYFSWGENMDLAAIALGYGSLYNHSVHANADFLLDFGEKTIEIMAIKDILPDTEITINYHGETGDASPLWFDVA